MEHFKALVLALCLHVVIGASPSRNDAGISFMRQQHLEASADDATNQPLRLEGEPTAEQEAPDSVSLLSVVQRLQHRPLASVSKAVRLQTEESAQSEHERQMLTDMGHLEDQLESWRSAEYSLRRQMAEQQTAMEMLKTQQSKAAREHEEAAMVWRCCKMFMCLLTLAGLALCVYIARLQRAQSKGFLAAPEPIPQNVMEAAEQSRLEAVSQNGSHPSIPEPVKHHEGTAAQLPEEREDKLQVTMSLPHPTLAENPLLEAANSPQQAEDVWMGSMSPRTLSPRGCDSFSRATSEGGEAKCEYFTLAEEPTVAPPSPRTSAEEDWWNDSASSY